MPVFYLLEINHTIGIGGSRKSLKSGWEGENYLIGINITKLGFVHY